MPASSIPSSEMFAPRQSRKAASSLEKPGEVRRLGEDHARAARSAAGSPRVPSSAARVFGPRPCASGIVISATASAPTIATASGDLPSRIAGTTNSSTSARLATSPSSDSAPRRRANTSTISTNAIASTASGRAALEVVERVLRARDRRLAGRRLGALGDEDLVARVEIRVEALERAELELHDPAGAGTAGQARGRELAALRAERRADRLAHLHHLGLLRVHRTLGREARLRVPRPEDREPRRGGHREPERDRAEARLIRSNVAHRVDGVAVDAHLEAQVQAGHWPVRISEYGGRGRRCHGCPLGATVRGHGIRADTRFTWKAGAADVGLRLATIRLSCCSPRSPARRPTACSSGPFSPCSTASSTRSRSRPLWSSHRWRWKAQGGNPELVYEVALWAFPAGLIGGRLYFLATSWSEVPDHWWGPFAIWDGGLGIWGGITGGILAGLWRTAPARADFPEFLDAAAPALLVAQAIGRVGNYFNQELFGGPTALPWALEIDPAHRPAGLRARRDLPPHLPVRNRSGTSRSRGCSSGSATPTDPPARLVRALRRRLLAWPHRRGTPARRPLPPHLRAPPELLRRLAAVRHRYRVVRANPERECTRRRSPQRRPLARIGCIVRALPRQCRFGRKAEAP